MVETSSLANGTSRGCQECFNSSLRPKQDEPWTGRQFGSWTVTGEPFIGSRRKRCVPVECSCGSVLPKMFVWKLVGGKALRCAQCARSDLSRVTPPELRHWHELPWEDDEAAQYVVASHPEGLPFEHVGELMGITRQRVEQIERQALARLGAWGRSVLRAVAHGIEAEPPSVRPWDRRSVPSDEMTECWEVAS